MIVSLFVTCISGCSDRIELHVKALEDENADVRASAATALGKIGPDARVAVAHLIESLNDGNQSVRASAASAMGQIGTSDARAAIPQVIEALKDEDADVRESAAGALGKIATALQDRNDTTETFDLEMASAALGRSQSLPTNDSNS